MIYQISYDLKSPTADYTAVYETITSFGDSLPILKSTWLVATEKTVSDMTDALIGAIQNGDRFFISGVIRDKYNGLHSRKTWKWIADHLNENAS